MVLVQEQEHVITANINLVAKISKLFVMSLADHTQAPQNPLARRPRGAFRHVGQDWEDPPDISNLGKKANCS